MFLDDFKPEDKVKMTDLLKKTGSANKDEAIAAQKIMAAALSEPLRQGILVGDIISNIFKPEAFDPNARVEYPIDFYRPDNAGEFNAYVIPNQGKIPQRMVEGDYVTVPTYDVGAGIDYLLRYAREARWDIIARALEVLEAGFVKKMNDDGWHTILTAAFDRNIVVNDSNAVPGFLTKRLISLSKLVMRRNAGGNSASLNRGKLTHIFTSPENMEDIRNWGYDQVDDFTRRQIFLGDDDEGTGPSLSGIYGVTLVDLNELGEGQEYQDYYQNVVAVGAANFGMATGDVEVSIGLDLSKNDSFVMPIREQLQVFEDETLHRERRGGYYAWASFGFAVLNNQRALLISN